MATRKEINIIRANDGNFVVTTMINGEMHMQVAVGKPSLFSTIEGILIAEEGSAKAMPSTLN